MTPKSNRPGPIDQEAKACAQKPQFCARGGRPPLARRFQRTLRDLEVIFSGPIPQAALS